MSWSLSKRDVSLRVTKFAKQEPKPIAGLSPIARALWRDKRAKEQQKRPEALVLNSKS